MSARRLGCAMNREEWRRANLWHQRMQVAFYAMAAIAMFGWLFALTYR